MQIVAYGAQDVFLSNKNKTTFNSNKSYQYAGKNNFYKKHNKKKTKLTNEIKNKENQEKINLKKENIIKMKNVMNKIKQPIYENKFNLNNNYNTDLGNFKNFTRCLSIKLMIKNNIVKLLEKNCTDFDNNLIPLAFVKIYYIFLYVTLKQFDTNSNINIKHISLNTIDSLYLLKIKNSINENNNIQKFIKIIETQLKIFFESQFGFKVKIELEKTKNIDNTQITKPNENCPITLEPFNNGIYFYCNVCNTKYSTDGLIYWCQTNHKCTTPWCSNHISKFNFYNENINFNPNETKLIEQINYCYNLITSF